MFKSNQPREVNRFKHILAFQGTRNSTVLLTAEHIAHIEDTNLLSLVEKFELLLIALGMKLTTEVFRTITYFWDEDSQIETSEEKDSNAISDFLATLPFSFYKDTYQKMNRLSSKKRAFCWFQVSVNTTVSYFVKNYSDTLSEFEEGILYGYPITSIRAFCGLIERRYQPRTVATYYLAGICSKQNWDEEQAYFDIWWNAIGRISPKLKAEGEKQFARIR